MGMELYLLNHGLVVRGDEELEKGKTGEEPGHTPEEVGFATARLRSKISPLQPLLRPLEALHWQHSPAIIISGFHTHIPHTRPSVPSPHHTTSRAPPNAKTKSKISSTVSCIKIHIPSRPEADVERLRAHP